MGLLSRLNPEKTKKMVFYLKNNGKTDNITKEQGTEGREKAKIKEDI